MHIFTGNPSAAVRSDPHKTHFQGTSIAFVNPDGISGKTRKPAIGALNCDIIALSETHLSKELMKSAEGGFPGYNPFWGIPVKGKNGGVGFLVKTNAFWHVAPISWPADSPCHSFVQAGRLHALSIFTGLGHSQFNIYVVYGISGARWNTELKDNTHKLIEAVCADIASKGLPAVMGGDFNLEIADSPLLERLPQIGFTNLAR